MAKGWDVIIQILVYAYDLYGEQRTIIMTGDSGIQVEERYFLIANLVVSKLELLDPFLSIIL